MVSRKKIECKKRAFWILLGMSLRSSLKNSFTRIRRKTKAEAVGGNSKFSVEREYIMKTEFSIRIVEMDPEAGFTGHLVLVAVEDLTSLSVRDAVDSWTRILKNADDLVFSDPIFEDSDPWFGFGVTMEDRILDEEALFSKIPNSDFLIETSVSEYIEALIHFNEENNDEGLATHEELETGTYAVLWLLKKNLKYLPLYIRYLNSLDLDHTVAQLDVLFQLAKRYSPIELEPLKKFAKNKDAQLLNDWLESDRVWNER